MFRGISSRRARILLAGQSVSVAGDGLAVLTVPLLALELSRNPLVAGLSAASVTIGTVAAGLPAGVIVDRTDPWRVLVGADVLRACLFCVLFGLAATRLLTAGLLLALVFTVGSCQVFFETALTVVIRDLLPEADLVRANSAMELANQLALVVGPGAVGALAAAASLQFALLVNALTFVVSLACLVGTRPAARPRPAAGETTAADLSRSLLDGFRYLGSTRPLLVLTVLQMIVNFGLASEKLLVFFATETLSMSPSAVGVIVSAGGLGGIAGALTAARIARRFRPTAVVAAGIAVASGAAVAMGGAGSFAALFVANLVYLWAVVVASLVNRTVRQLLTRRDMLGRATGTGRLLFRSVDPLGVLAMGGLTVAMHGDPRAAFVAGGLLACLATAVAWFGYFSTNCREY